MRVDTQRLEDAGEEVHPCGTIDDWFAADMTKFAEEGEIFVVWDGLEVVMICTWSAKVVDEAGGLHKLKTKLSRRRYATRHCLQATWPHDRLSGAKYCKLDISELSTIQLTCEGRYRS